MNRGGYRINRHRTQYDGNPSTTKSGCTWTSVANGADAVTGGRVDKTPEQVHALVAHNEETDPSTPGWSMDDADKAAGRLGLGFEVRSGQGWRAVDAALDSGHYVVLQGDSDQFGNNTCSGKFDGDHAIGVSPAKSGTRRWIDDPICLDARWEEEAVLRRYAEKLDPRVRFGVFTAPVTKAALPPAPPLASPTRYVVSISGRTPLYTRAEGVRRNAVSSATYVCGMSRRHGKMWFRIISKAPAGATANAGRWFMANAHTKVRFA